MSNKMPPQRLPKSSQSRMSLSDSSTRDHNDSSSSGAELPLRTVLRKNASNASVARSQTYDSQAGSTAGVTGTRRRKSILERGSTFGSRDVDSARRVPSSTFGNPMRSSNTSLDSGNPPSRTQSNAGSSTVNEENETLSENGEFLVPVNFDDFHNSITSKEPSLSHFPLPGRGAAGYEGTVAIPKPTNRWTTGPSVQTAKEPRPADFGGIKTCSVICILDRESKTPELRSPRTNQHGRSSATSKIDRAWKFGIRQWREPCPSYEKAELFEKENNGRESGDAKCCIPQLPPRDVGFRLQFSSATCSSQPEGKIAATTKPHRAG
ncbi:hypothetical protein CIHG_06164 [Coccidioides immitis H538.4]|uniref:Uncharacterized protein n=1 Tax=Coccidioides immitis H538.4 TaxID=396776 RepID=A0A0J8RUY7_COCIT|nr:hypothetical protein CIHG_06164 [Coccidioides immitis H538.4]